jgi:hypothetical protein
MENLHKLFLAIQEYAEEEKVVELTSIRDEFTFGIDDELYFALTEKPLNEPVFDIHGRELPSMALDKIRKGLEQRQHIKPVSKKKQREAKHERPHNQAVQE